MRYGKADVARRKHNPKSMQMSAIVADRSPIAGNLSGGRAKPTTVERAARQNRLVLWTVDLDVR